MRRPSWDVTDVFSPGALAMAFAAVIISSIWDVDTLMNAAGVTLLLDATKVHIERKLRER